MIRHRDGHERFHPDPERSDWRGCVVVWSETLLALRGGDWVCRRGNPRVPIVSEPTPLLQLTFAILLGFIGALLALFLQKFAIGLVGFIAGGRFAVGLMATFVAQYASHYWLTFIIGGLIGTVLLLMLFDWALIFVSSLIGAHLVTSAISSPPTGEVLLFSALVLFGVLVQAASMRKKGLPS